MIGAGAVSESIVLLAVIDALLVALFFLFRVLPWSSPGPWRLIWGLASLTAVAFMLAELAATLTGGSALNSEHQGPLFLAILAATACFIFAYLHGHRVTEEALTLSFTDGLTGLANRRSFDAQLGVALARGTPLALLYIDLDSVKEVNDRFGHERGDELLRSFAALLRSLLTPGDSAARLGGDEFALLLHADSARAASIGERALAGLREIATTAGAPVGASIGIATDADGATPEEVLRAADRAMYRAKRAGGARLARARADDPAEATARR